MTDATRSSTQSDLSGRISLYLLMLLCIVPFLSHHHYPPISSFYNEWIAAVIALVASASLLRQDRLIFPTIAWLPIGLILVLALQLAVGKTVYWQNHYLTMLYLGLTTVIMIVGASLRHSLSLKKIVPILAVGLIVGGFLSLIIIPLSKTTWVSSSFLSYIIQDYRGSHIAQINHLANYLALCLGSVCYLLLAGKIPRYAAMLLGLVFIIGLAYTGQRMALLYVVLISCGGWILTRQVEGQQSKTDSRLLLWIIPAFILAEYLLPLFSALASGVTPTSRFLEMMGKESQRLIYLQQAWQLFLNHPILGAGWGEFGWNNFIVTDDYPAQRGLTNHAHNLVLHLLAETGLVGTVICCMSIGLWLLKQFKVAMTMEKWWIFVLLGVIGAHSMLEYPLWFAYFLLLSALLLGLGDESVTVRDMRLMPVIVVLVLIFGGWNILSIQQHYAKLESTLTTFRESPDEAVNASTALTELYEMRTQTVLTPYVDNLLIRLLPNLPELREDKLIINDKVVRFWPGMAETYTQASLLALNQRPQEAVEMMKKAIKQFPQFQQRFRPALLQQIHNGDQELVPLLLMLEPQNSAGKKLPTAD